MVSKHAIIACHFNCLTSSSNILSIHLGYNCFKVTYYQSVFCIQSDNRITSHTSKHQESILWHYQIHTSKKSWKDLGAYFVSIDVNNSHITYSKSKNTSQIPDQAEGSLLLPIQIANSSINQGTIPCMIILPNLHLLNPRKLPIYHP